MSSIKFSNLIELLRWRALHQTHQTGYTFLADGEHEGASLTYGELDRHARAIGAFLYEHGAWRERVLLLYPPGLEFLAAFFGCLYAGAIAVPAYPPRNIRHLPRIHTIVDDAQAKLLLTVDKTRSRIQKWRDQRSSLTSLQMLVTDTLPPGIEDTWQEPEIHGHDLSFLQYTSGSTSSPKGVMVSHENLLYNSALIQDYFEHTKESRSVIWLPPYHDMGLIGGILQPLFVGFPVVLLAPEAFLQRPVRWLQAISHYRATVSGGPNFAYELCLTKITPEQRETLDLSSWDLAFNGAEPIHPKTLERFATTFAPCGFRTEAWYPCYGLAEATLFVAGGNKSAVPVIRTFHATEMEGNRVIELSENEENGKMVHKLVGCGQNLREQTIVIVDPDSLIQCPPDQIGEIWISGASVTQGYWNRPDINQETFQVYLANTDEGPFLRTGDLGFIKDDELFITGRLKDLIIIRGRNHYPQDIEWTVEQSYQAIRKNCCAAFSINESDEERLVVVAEIERRYRERRRRSNTATHSGEERRRLSDRRQAEVVDTGFNVKIHRPLKTEEAITHIQQAIAEHHGLQVHSIVLLKYGTIPRTSSGKIQRHACKAGFLDDGLDIVAKWHIDKDKPSQLTPHESQKPLTGMWETFVAQLWGAALQLDWETLTADTQFFQIGGDSLHAATVTGALSNTLRAEFEADLVYQYPTVKALGAYLKQHYGNVPATTNVEESLVTHYKQYCRPESIEFPVLPLQKLIFDLQASSGVSGYMFLDIELQGTLDVTLFQKAFRLLLDRHPALRAAFKPHADGPLQYILPLSESKAALYYKDLSQFTLPQAQFHLEAETDSLLHHFFDNHVGDTFQATLCKMTLETYHLLINFDHLVLDGFSLKKFFEDFQGIYRDLLHGEFVEPKPQTTINFKEYVEIYTALQESEQRERDSEYWLQKIPNSVPFHRFPNTDNLDEITGFGVYIHTLNLTIIEQLKTHARTYDLTLFSILMASFFKLLASWTGSNLINIYTLYLNRRPYAPDVHDILGCFADALPIWIDNALDGDLLTLAGKIHQDLTEIHRHNSLSIIDVEELIVKKQQVSLDDMDLVTFSFLPFPSAEPDAETPYRISSIRAQSSDAATFLELLVYEACGEFVCSWNFARNRFSSEKITALATQYENILQDFACYPQLMYWKKQLENLPVIQLPTDHFRSPTQSIQRNTQNLQIPQPLYDKLYGFSQHQNVTLFTTLFTAFQVLLHRYTNQDDIATGTFLGSQEHGKTGKKKPSHGNPVLIRTDFSDNPTFQNLLERVRQVCLEAQRHQDFPLDRLLGEVRPEREADNVPLFQVMFALQNDLMRGSVSQEISMNILNSGSVADDCDLFLSLEKKGQALIGSWHYHSGLFEVATIERMTGHFQTLLEEIVANPEQHISDIPILTKTEQHQILVEWNNTKTDYPTDICLHQLFEVQVARTPDAVAVKFEEQLFTYQQLNAKANQLAHYLQNLGIGPDVLVGICIERSLEMIVGVLGILKAGGAYVPLDPAYPRERLTFMLEDSRVGVLLTQKKFMTGFSEYPGHVVCLDTDWESISQEQVENPVSRVHPENLVYCIYTSGSTGRPKGVAMKHLALSNLIAWQLQRPTFTNNARTLQFSPVSFDVSFQEMFSTWCSGGTLVLIPENTRRDCVALLQFLSEKMIERLFLPFVALQHLAEAAEKSETVPASLREIITAGEQLQITPSITNLFKRLHTCCLDNQYGPSESHVVTAFALSTSVNSWSVLPPIGYPIASTHIYILDSQLRPIPIGVPGELYIGGDCLARGYLNRPKITAERFIPNPFCTEPGERLYKTGDLARYLPDGTIEFLGRIDHQVKIRGFRIELGEIEAALAEHPVVRKNVVMAREDVPGNKRLVAYVVPEQGQASSPSDLRNFLKENLPEYMIPAIFVMLDALPLTPSGKINRRALPVPDETLSGLEEGYVAPRTPIEETLVAIWSKILGMNQIGVHDSFFELGGHSLLATQILSQVREAFGVEIPLHELFETAHIAGLAETIVVKQLEKADSDLLAQVLAETENLSEDEVIQQLLTKSE